MISFNNDELEQAPHLGDFITCPHCGNPHKIQYGQEEQPDGTWKESSSLSFYVCGDKPYLAGINGKNIIQSFNK